MNELLIPSGTYSQSGLISQMRTQLNIVQTLYTEGANILGFDLNPAILDTGKFSLSFSKSEMIDITDANCNLNKMTYVANVFTSTNPASANHTYDKWVTPTLKFNNGSGQGSAEFSDNFCLALLSDPIPIGQTLALSDIAIGLIADAGSYYKVINNIETILNIVPNFGDVIKVVLELGKIKYYADLNLIFETPYDYNTSGFYLIAGLQNPAKKISNFDYTPQSFVDNASYPGLTIYNDSNVQEVLHSDLNALSPKKFTLTFESNALSNLLGYNTNILNVSANSKSFIANNIFRDSILNESIDVQLNLGHIVSYDGFTGKSAPIIGVIPIASAESFSDRLSYSSSELLYVDLNNKFAIPTTTLNMRILGSQTGVELVFEKGISLTLAVRTKENLM